MNKFSKLLEYEKGYLAGFFDGDGSIGIYSTGSGKYKDKVYAKRHVLQIILCQSTRDVLDDFHNLFDGNIYWFKRERVWRWYISSLAAEKFLIQIEPYLRIKKAEAQLGVEFREFKNKHLYNKKTEDYTDTVIEFSDKMKSLKNRAKTDKELQNS